jgi:quercetin dioxygenase-like cupin family protein
MPRLTVLLTLLALSPGGTWSAAETAHGGSITPLNSARFAIDDDVKCLNSALENGDPQSGRSTFLLRGNPGCHVPPHYHTAEEQLIVIRGSVWTAMEGMRGALLTTGGVAVMPGKAVHWFSCQGTHECLIAVTFDRPYDIVWTQPPVSKPR